MTEDKPKRPRSPKPGGERPLRRRDAPAADKPKNPKFKAGPRSEVKSSGADRPHKPRLEKLARAAPPRRRTEKPAARAPQEKPHPGERIAKVMARAGACSRRDAEQWIAEGRVAVNGRTLTSPAFNVREGDRITVDGEPLAERERTRLFLFHKPAGLVTSAKDPEGRETVFDYVAQRRPDLPRLVSIGRLDINTEGLLLLSNDGSLARVLELPATGWTRRYRVRVHGEVDQALLDELAKGVTVDDVTYAPIDARLDRVQGANAWITMSLSEGKNREIKRVLEHLGIDVARLIRVSYGPFQLGDMPEGAIEEVRLKTLREQLGKGLAELAGVDFSSPLRETPTATEREATRVAVENRPRKHVSAMRKQRAAAEAEAPRARIERAVTADRKGRAVAVERVVAKKAEGAATSRNARRFEALRREQEGEAAAKRPPRERGPEAQTRERKFERPRRLREEGAETPRFKREGFERPRAEQRDERPRRSREKSPEREHDRKFERPRRLREEGAETPRFKREGFERPREERRGEGSGGRETPFKRLDERNLDRPRKPREGRREGAPPREERPRRAKEASSFNRGGGKAFEGARKARPDRDQKRAQNEGRPQRAGAKGPGGSRRGGGKGARTRPPRG